MQNSGGGDFRPIFQQLPITRTNALLFRLDPTMELATHQLSYEEPEALFAREEAVDPGKGIKLKRANLAFKPAMDAIGPGISSSIRRGMGQAAAVPVARYARKRTDLPPELYQKIAAWLEGRNAQTGVKCLFDRVFLEVPSAARESLKLSPDMDKAWFVAPGGELPMEVGCHLVVIKQPDGLTKKLLVRL